MLHSPLTARYPEKSGWSKQYITNLWTSIDKHERVVKAQRGRILLRRCLEIGLND
jgi:hypothetical protein